MMGNKIITSQLKEDPRAILATGRFVGVFTLIQSWENCILLYGTLLNYVQSAQENRHVDVNGLPYVCIDVYILVRTVFWGHSVVMAVGNEPVSITFRHTCCYRDCMQHFMGCR
jgi:hypothetical protein